LKGTAKSTTVGKTLIKAVAKKAPPEAERLPLRIRITFDTNKEAFSTVASLWENKGEAYEGQAALKAEL
jgi:hypothetical protein